MHNHLWHSLLSWYEEHKRDLPWRHTHDPYAVLVSEVMLQQTGVERVVPKYLAFLERWPTLQALADASTAEVIRLWGGLGYNRRAVWLQLAAREAIGRWGRLPSDVTNLESLPGIGPYTAHAVACFAFGAQVAVTDTNVRRVLTRLVHRPDDARLSPKQSLALADEMLPPGRAYEWNQALMDLGATICLQRSPRCLVCPLRCFCKAYPTINTPTTDRRQRLGETKPRWKESPFVGSRRYYRGRVVSTLRQLQTGDSIAIGELGRRIKADFADTDLAWLSTLVEDLAKEGLVALADERVSLPD